MAAAWGRPPSPHVLALVLRGLGEQLRQEAVAEQQLLVLQAARDAVLDLSSAAAVGSKQSAAARGAAAAPAAWPPLDAPLAEAALQLLLACHDAAVSSPKLQAAAGSGSLAPLALLEEGGRGLMAGLCAHRTPLPPAVCDQLARALYLSPDLADWAGDRFGATAMNAVVSGAGAEGAAPVLRPRRGRPRKQAGAGASEVQGELQLQNGWAGAQGATASMSGEAGPASSSPSLRSTRPATQPTPKRPRRRRRRSPWSRPLPRRSSRSASQVRAHHALCCSCAALWDRTGRHRRRSLPAHCRPPAPTPAAPHARTGHHAALRFVREHEQLLEHLYQHGWALAVRRDDGGSKPALRASWPGMSRPLLGCAAAVAAPAGARALTAAALPAPAARPSRAGRSTRSSSLLWAAPS